jgi:putative phosphoribosyl transferase
VIERFIEQEQRELARCEQLYRANCSAPAVRDHTVILVDDGMATGATMQLAVARLRQEHPARIVVAVPVASASAYQKLRTVADAVICLHVPARFYSVGCWYRHFPAVTDAEICSLLKRARSASPSPAHR